MAERKRAEQIKDNSRTKIKTKEPSKYKVIMLNDDVTTMEFVVEVLMDIFGKNNEEAVTLMMKVHKTGEACIALYPYDIAVTKQRAAIDRARAEGYPFQIRLEQE